MSIRLWLRSLARDLGFRFGSPRRDRLRKKPLARYRPWLEVLEDRVVPATTITITGPVTLDESPRLQNTGTPVGAEDNNDNDVSLATLQSGAPTFFSRLGALGFSTTFATANGVAQSASNFITVLGGTVSNLGFVDGNGNALPVFTPGVTNPTTGV